MNNVKQMTPYQKIGIDKIKFTNLAICAIDIPYLMQHEKVTLQQADNATSCRRRTPDGKGITKIIIRDNEIFSEMIIGSVKDSNNIPIEYVYLTMVIPEATGNNLVPWCYTDYDCYLDSVFCYIQSEYHISLLADDIKIKYMEVNTNIPLQYGFSNYSRAIRLLMSLLNNRMGKLSTYEAVDDTVHAESFKRGNKSVDVIMYDKLQEIIDKRKNYDNLDSPILRIEYRLKTSRKIKSAFGSNLWRELDDEKIAEFFICQIRTQLREKYRVWLQQKQNELKRLIVYCRAKSSKTWHHLLMQEIRNRSEQIGLPFILDIEQVYDAVRSFDDRNADRKCNAIAGIKITDDVYKNHDLNKMDEIFSGVELAYKNTVELFYSQP